MMFRRAGPARASIHSLRCSPLSRRAISTTDPAPEKLAGTVPAHRSYIFLHTPQSPSAYPARYATPIQRKLLLSIAPWGASVNFAWSPSQPVHPHTSIQGSEHPQAYYLTAFSSVRGKLEIEEVSLENVEAVGKRLQAHAEPREPGGAVASAIRAELDRRRQLNPSSPSTQIKLAEVAHVGGHEYAANVLVYPHGEWLGNVRPENVSKIIDAILALPIKPMHPEDMPTCPSHWRGRMGLSKQEQIELFDRFTTTS